MKSLNTAYAHFYNKSEKRVGYVFRDRYLSEAIRSERQLYNCLAYIHYNPIEAKIVSLPDKYRYSSYIDYQKNTGIVDDETLRLVFGSKYQYMEMFNFIHFGIGEGLEATDEKKVDKVVDMNEVEKLKGIEEKCRKLKEQNLSNRKIADILNIDRNKVNKIINKDCQ